MIKGLWIFNSYKGLWTNGVVSITVGTLREIGDKQLKKWVYRDYGIIIHEPLRPWNHRDLKLQLEPPWRWLTPEEIIDLLIQAGPPLDQEFIEKHKP